MAGIGDVRHTQGRHLLALHGGLTRGDQRPTFGIAGDQQRRACNLPPPARIIAMESQSQPTGSLPCHCMSMSATSVATVLRNWYAPPRTTPISAAQHAARPARHARFRHSPPVAARAAQRRYPAARPAARLAERRALDGREPSSIRPGVQQYSRRYCEDRARQFASDGRGVTQIASKKSSRHAIPRQSRAPARQ